MALTVFLVPSVTPHDAAAVWQLDLLAQAYGLATRSARRTRATPLSNSDRAGIRDSDAVVAIVTQPLDAHAKAEISFAKQLHRPVLAMLEEGVALHAANLPAGIHALRFGRNTSIEDIGKAIAQYVSRTTGRHTTAETNTALKWLLGIGIGLFALGALAEE